jgi:hypothetical protein
MPVLQIFAVDFPVMGHLKKCPKLRETFLMKFLALVSIINIDK